MAHKTFISYKYSEARQLRDDIIHALGDDGSLKTRSLQGRRIIGFAVLFLLLKRKKQ